MPQGGIMEDRVKIQFLNGGLANQAFQYIFAKYYELSFPGDIMYMDDSYFAVNTVHNGYELGKVFGIKPHFVSECFDDDVWAYMLEEKKGGKSIPQILLENGMDMYMVSEVGPAHMHFNPFSGRVVNVSTHKYDHAIIGAPGDVYFHGYWINKWWMEKYKDNFLREFTFPPLEDSTNKAYLEAILTRPSVCMHIRRGDYVTIGSALDSSYFLEGVEEFGRKLMLTPDMGGDIQKWTVFVFSDDIAWCKENRKDLGLDKFGETVFVEGNMGGKNYIDMQLMSQCEAVIMSNSAFSYLATLLNTRKKLVINQTIREV